MFADGIGGGFCMVDFILIYDLKTTQPIISV
jgi:hypothetical protein